MEMERGTVTRAHHVYIVRSQLGADPLTGNTVTAEDIVFAPENPRTLVQPNIRGII